MKKQTKHTLSQEDNPIYQSLKIAIKQWTDELDGYNRIRDEIIRKATIKIDKKREKANAELIKYQQTFEKHFPSESFPKEGWREKVLWALETSKKALNTTEITTKIAEQEDDVKVDKILPAIRLAVNRMLDKKALLRYKNEAGHYNYGLPEWFKDGKIRDAYI